MLPQVTITGGTGARRALPFQVCLAIFGVPFKWEFEIIIAYFGGVVKFLMITRKCPYKMGNIPPISCAENDLKHLFIFFMHASNYNYPY
jgi:hypothetical protein